MADNYLERKMEELRSGKLAVRNRRPGIRPNSKRILIAGGCHGAVLEKALEYRKQGHRVAIFDEDEATGRRLAHDHGIRFTPISISERSGIHRELHSLLSAWRSLDILIATEDISAILSNAITDWKENLPIPDKSPIEIVIIK